MHQHGHNAFHMQRILQPAGHPRSGAFHWTIENWHAIRQSAFQ